MVSILGCGNIGGGIGGGGSSVMLMMAKYMKQELTSDAEEEGLVPTLPTRFTSMRKVPSLSDLSDQESSLGKLLYTNFSTVTLAELLPSSLSMLNFSSSDTILLPKATTDPITNRKKKGSKKGSLYLFQLKIYQEYK